MGAFTLGGSAGFAANLAGFNAYAADTSDYKALVCVFLFGGLDCHDTVMPYDVSAYNAWADIRRPLVNQFAGARNRNALLPLSGTDANGRSFAFGPEMPQMQALYNAGALSVVGNVGPLIEPMTRETYRNGSGQRPARLFSHNDQQSTWMASEPEGARLGWGGRIADIMLAAGANPRATFTAVSASGNAVFLSGDVVRPFQVGSRGSVSLRSTSGDRFLGSTQLPQIFDDHFRDFQGSLDSLFQQDMINAQGFALDANADVASALDTDLPAGGAFPEDNRLAGQLRVVAQLIAQQASLGVQRQIFFVSTGGFDTHSNQAQSLPNLMGQVSSAMGAFYDTTVQLGVADKVTTFTASDFGRTLRINGDGTDHGWGGHHLVMGGAVNGGQILGAIPEPAFDHSADSGRGRLIPALSVDQYAAALGGWFGLSDSEVVEALPGAANFDRNALNGLLV